MRRQPRGNCNPNKETSLETEVIEAKPETASELFTRLKTAKLEAAKPDAVAAKAVADKTIADAAAKPVPGEPVEKRASGDERKFSKIRTALNREIGALRQQIEALSGVKPAKVVPETGTPPKREDFAAGTDGDALFADAKTAHAVQRAIDKKTLEDNQAIERKAIMDGYNERMAKAPEKYPDWDATVKAAAADPDGQALKGDLGKECPALFMAIAKSKYNDDCFYAWLKEPARLQALIDLYRSGPEGVTDALVEFHRFEGRVGKDAKAAEKAKPQKADDAVKVSPKPKPSGEVQVRGGAAAPDGKPALFLPGTNTLNPAYKAWQRAQSSRN